jgi:hypothetical protein
MTSVTARPLVGVWHRARDQLLVADRRRGVPVAGGIPANLYVGPLPFAIFG